MNIPEQKINCGQTTAVKCLQKKEKVVENKIKEKEEQKASLFHRWSNNIVRSLSKPKQSLEMLTDLLNHGSSSV